MSLDLELALLAARCHREAADAVPPRHPQTDHAKVAAHARSVYGGWVLAVAYRSAMTAKSMLHAVEHGKHYYTPAGAFKAHTVPVGLGTGLFVRYVGGAR